MITKMIPPPGTRTALSGYVLAIAHAIEEAGVDYRSLMVDAGLDPKRLDDFGYRFPQEQVTALWEAAILATSDANFGLKVAKHIRPSSYHVVGHAMLCSENMRSAARRFARFAKLVSDSAIVRFIEKETDCRLEIAIETNGLIPLYQALDTVLAGFLEYCRWLIHDDFDPIAVYFSHPPPANQQEYSEIFRCPIYYKQEVNALVFASTEMDKTILGGNEKLCILLDELASRYLADHQLGRFSRRVREILLENLSVGEYSRSETASCMNMTGRTLARRLAEENTTFYELLKQVREAEAYNYLKHTDMNVEDIAYQLGFSDRGTFSRAFKTWTGKRPTEWRSEHNFLIDFEIKPSS